MKAVVERLGGACLIGAVTGLRSQWGLAAVAWTAVPPAAVRGGAGARQSLLARPWVRGATLAAAAGEFVADKSPRVPSRLSAAGLVPRVLMSVPAAVLLSRRRRPVPSATVTAAVGASAAVAAAFAGTRWRQAVEPRSKAVAGGVEDVVALALAWAACTRTGGSAHAGTGTPRGGGAQTTGSQDGGESASGPKTSA